MVPGSVATVKELKKKIIRKFPGPPRNRTPVIKRKIRCPPTSGIVELTLWAK